MRYLFTSLVLGTIFCATLSAQSFSYPEQFKSEFENADASARPGMPSTAVIALPLSSLSSKVARDLAGQAAAVTYVDPSSFADFNAMRDFCASIDGFVIDANFAGSPDLLFLKALADRNVPMLGKCDALDSLDYYERRLDDGLLSAADLVRKASVYKKAKQLMSEIVVADTHCDLPMELLEGSSLGERNYNQVSIQKMQEGGMNVMFLASFLAQKPITAESIDATVKQAHEMIEISKANIDKYSDYCELALTPQDAARIKSRGKVAFYLAIENGFAIGREVNLLKEYSDMGVVCMTICHSQDNDICGSSNPKSVSGNAGLTPFGRKVIRKMNSLGMMVDLSHASEKTFFDVLSITKAPVICTHSGASAIYKHDRSLTDEQLLALKKNGGVIQQYLVSFFMDDDRYKASLDDMVEHIKHIVQVAGIDHVGIGSDFDGGGGASGYNGCNDYVNICVRLLEEGFSESDITKIFGGNLMRVMSENQKLAK